MSSRRTLSRNAVWNTAGLVVEAGAGFLVMPFLIRNLGQEGYGIWVVLAAVFGYFGLLDLGIRGAIGRHVALYHSRADQDGVNRTVTAGLAFLSAIGLAGLGAIAVSAPLFFRVFEIHDAHRAGTEVALRLVGLQFAFFLVATVFDATLWGLQRFDWLNIVDIPAALLRTALTLYFVRSPGDIPSLAWVMVGVTVATGLSKAVLCFRAAPGLRIGSHYLTRSSSLELASFGSWNLITNVARVSRRQFSVLLIGVLLGVSVTTIFSVADRLLSAVTAALAAVTGVLTPYATSLHAARREADQRRLFLAGGRYNSAMAFFMSGLLIVMGGPLIDLWVGSAMAPAAAVLAILVTGEALAGTQYVTNGILVATGRLKAPALFAIAEAGTVCLLTYLLCPRLGLTGVGLALACPALIFRGVAPLLQGSNAVGVTVWGYLFHAVVPSLACAVVSGGAVGLLSHAYPAASWSVLVAYAGIYTAVFGACFVIFTGPTRVRNSPHVTRNPKLRLPGELTAGTTHTPV